MKSQGVFMRLAVVAVIAAGCVLPMAGCGGSGSGGERNYDVLYYPSRLSFSHKVGKDDCPQLIGYITLLNDADTECHIDFSGGVPSALTITDTWHKLDPGEEIRVPVYFNCSTQESFQGQITFKIRRAAIDWDTWESAWGVPVTGRIN